MCCVSWLYKLAQKLSDWTRVLFCGVLLFLKVKNKLTCLKMFISMLHIFSNTQVCVCVLSVFLFKVDINS